jgi:hypothetical protein
MNIKLLKELYKQAETECGWSEEKFAELIVQECIGVADHSNVTGKSIIGERIKQHFGVEE